MKCSAKIRVLTIALAVGSAGALPVFAQTLDREFDFASGLIEWGFSDYALKLADKLLVEHPETADRVNLIKAQSLINSRKFADAEALLATMPAGNQKADAIRLALANAYGSLGEPDKAKAIYDDFFKRYASVPSDPDLLRFYRNAAYQYGIMLEKAGDLLGALGAYDKALKTEPEKDIKRRLQHDQSQVYLKLAQKNQDGKRDEYAVKTRQMVEQIQWGGVDIWFGQSIITLANVELIYNDEAKAQKVLADYADIFEQIDVLLQENQMSLALSPMAGKRYLSGQLFQRAAERAANANDAQTAVAEYGKALGEYYNTFVKYGDSDVGPDAGVRAQEIIDLLASKYGKKVNIDLGAQAAKAAQTQFRLADTLFQEKKYEEAIKEYLRAANRFPESDVTVTAMANLILSYANIDDTLSVRMLAAYVAERFGNRDAGADALLAAGKFYVDKNRPELFIEMYNAYLDGFPKHERAGTILFFLATQRKKAGDEAGAASYFQRIIEQYPNDQYYPRAVNQVAWSYYQASNFTAAVDSFRRLVKDAPPSPDRANAQFNLADSLVRQDMMAEAVVELETLIGWIAPANNPYSNTPADAAKVRDTLQKATFLRAQCLARMTGTAEQVADYRDKAIKAFDLYVRMFGDSDLAPRALNGKGTVLLELKKFDEATATFDELTSKYPNSPEGKNALFSLARAAMEIKQFDQGIAAFRRMMNDSPRYKAEEFIRLGQLMLDAGYSTEAIEAYQEVQKKVAALPAAEQEASRPLIERSLIGIARSYYAAKKYPETIKAVQELMTRYPKSGLFYDAMFLQGEAYRDDGQLANAVNALSEVFRFATEPALITRATFTLGEIQRKNGDLTDALASYQRIALLSDRTKPENLANIETAIIISIEIAAELGRHPDVISNCDDYMKLFPQGKSIEQVRRMRGEAVLKSASAPAPVAAGAAP